MNSDNLIQLLIVLGVISIIYIVITYFPLPEPLGKIARIVLMLFGVGYLIYFLANFF